MLLVASFGLNDEQDLNCLPPLRQVGGQVKSTKTWRSIFHNQKSGEVELSNPKKFNVQRYSEVWCTLASRHKLNKDVDYQRQYFSTRLEEKPQSTEFGFK